MITATADVPVTPRARQCGVALRPEVAADLPFLQALYRSTREAELERTQWPEAQKTQFIELQFRAQRSHYHQHYPDALWLILEQQGDAIGRLYLERWSAEHRIIDIALQPQWRGQGIGQALLLDVIDEAMIAGKAVGIHVEKQNPAMSLYLRLGFRCVEDKGVYDLLKLAAGQPPLG